MTTYKCMYLVSKIVYDSLNNQKDKINNHNLDGASTINIRQLNNLDVNDGGRVTIQNDDHYATQKHISPETIADRGDKGRVVISSPNTTNNPPETTSLDNTRLTHDFTNDNGTSESAYDIHQQRKYVHPKKSFRDRSLNSSFTDAPSDVEDLNAELESASDNVTNFEPDNTQFIPPSSNFAKPSEKAKKFVNNPILSQAQLVMPERFSVRSAKPQPSPGRIIEERTQPLDETFPARRIDEITEPISDGSNILQSTAAADINYLPRASPREEKTESLIHRKLTPKSSLKSCWVSLDDTSSNKMRPSVKRVHFDDNNNNSEEKKNRKREINTSAMKKKMFVDNNNNESFVKLTNEEKKNRKRISSEINTPAMNEVIAKKSKKVSLKKVTKAKINAAVDRVIARKGGTKAKINAAVDRVIARKGGLKKLSEADINAAVDRVIKRKTEDDWDSNTKIFKKKNRKMMSMQLLIE
jgi:hypothetical protein